MCLSLASEWIENQEGELEKQKYERKAFARLAVKLKKHYPRLPVCIPADGLYSYEGTFDICQGNGWKYIFVLKDNTLKSVQEDLVLPRRRSPKKSCYHVKGGLRIASQYRFENGMAYKKRQVNWIECLEARTRDMPHERRPAKEKDAETHCFAYLTNLEADGGNIIALAAGGRLRWKIENEGFITQKRGGYELEHKFCRTSLKGLKNYYTLLQIAHALNQFVDRGGGSQGATQDLFEGNRQEHLAHAGSLHDLCLRARTFLQWERQWNALCTRLKKSRMGGMLWRRHPAPEIRIHPFKNPKLLSNKIIY